MKVTLGYECDSGAYPDALEGGSASCGRVVLGPLGFLGMLETQLGLLRKPVHNAVRIAQYLKALAGINDGERFYSESFQADSWSSAKELLYWRDELAMAGWRGKTIHGESERLKTFCLIEAGAGVELAAGIGDRIQDVIDGLKKGINPEIGSLTLIELEDTWPALWREVFGGLEKLGTKISAYSTDKPSCSPEITLLISDTETEAAEAIASWLASEREKNDSVLLIRGSGSPILDAALHRFGLPRLGADSRSPWRAASQVLGLVLSNLWAPFDPYKLLEFLSIPRSPISKRFAHYLENALREHPGLNGPKWEEAWSKIDASFREEKMQQGISGEELDRLAFQHLNELSSWIGEERYDPAIGIPAEKAILICTKVKDWAAQYGGVEEDPLLLAASGLAEDARQSIEASGMALITKPQLDRILDSVTGEGLEDPGAFSEAAPWSQVASPGQVWGPAKTIVWWNCIQSDLGHTSASWTEFERRSLAETGVILETSAEKRLRESASWGRAVTLASERLILVLPRMIAGEPATPHPFLDEVRHKLDSSGGIESITKDISRLWEVQGGEICGRTIERKEVLPDPIPAPRKEWPINEGGSWERDPETYSSMALLVQCPLAWFFKYIFGLERGTPLSLPAESAMLGNLAHAIVEMLFSESFEWAPERARGRAIELYRDLVPKMAAPLLQPGREIDLNRYEENISRSVESLVRLIGEAGWKVVATEKKVVKNFLSPDRTFTGRIDLLLKIPDGRNAVWDLKWSSRSKYKREEMEGGKALQLAVYCWLTGQEKAFPPGAYFMLSQGELISSPYKGLPDTSQFHDVDLEDIWEKGLEKYRMRLYELSSGVLCGMGQVPGEPEESKEETAFELDPPCQWCDYITLCGLEQQKS